MTWPTDSATSCTGWRPSCGGHAPAVSTSRRAHKTRRDAEIETIVAARLQEFDLRGATAALLDAIAVLNRDLESTAPWRLSPGRDATELSEILGRQLATARAIAVAATPIIPALAARLAEHLESEVPDGSPFARLAAP